jgi:hypothetical protein
MPIFMDRHDMRGAKAEMSPKPTARTSKSKTSTGSNT